MDFMPNIRKVSSIPEVDEEEDEVPVTEADVHHYDSTGRKQSIDQSKTSKLTKKERDGFQIEEVEENERCSIKWIFSCFRTVMVSC